jgi:hypothetical protein
MQLLEEEAISSAELEALFSTSFHELSNLTLHDVPPQFSRKFRVRSQGAIDRAIEKITAKQAALTARFQAEEDGLLPCEASGKAKLKDAHNRMLRKLDHSILGLRHEHMASPLDEVYDRINPWFLEATTWSEKYQCSVPLFGVFALNDPVCQINIDLSYSGRSHKFSSASYLTPYMANSFFDLRGLREFAATKLFEAVANMPLPKPEPSWSISESPLEARTSLYAKIKFSGAIPQHIRSAIRTATSQFEQIFIVAEAQNWEISTNSYVATPTIPIGDPLVLGRSKEGLFWLVASFDTTSSESYVLDEFTGPEQV